MRGRVPVHGGGSTVVSTLRLEWRH
jgi:hypothetical protein